MSKRWGAIALLAVVGVLGTQSAASASQGSVPAQVSAYAADPAGLVSRLDDLFGPGASGDGIEFGETTTVGQLNRVFTFTPDFIAGDATDIAVERANEWSAPILIDEKPVGLATIWINPATVAPELADFEPTAELATALTDVPAEVFVVHDPARDAWFTLVDTALTTLSAGSSGADADVSLSEYQDVLTDAAEAAAQAEQPVNTGAILSITIIAAAALAVIIVLLIPLIRGRSRRAEAAADEPSTPAQPVTADEPVAVATSAVDPTSSEPEVEPVAAAKPARKPAKKPVATVTPQTEPVAAATPATTAMIRKPTASRPAASRAPKPSADAD
jgi:hypothetical protein